MHSPSKSFIETSGRHKLTSYYSFSPSIVQGLGYTATRAQLMTVPPFAVSFVGESIVVPCKGEDVLIQYSGHNRRVYIRSVPLPWHYIHILLHSLRYRVFSVFCIRKAKYPLRLLVLFNFRCIQQRTSGLCLECQ